MYMLLLKFPSNQSFTGILFATGGGWVTLGYRKGAGHHRVGVKGGHRQRNSYLTKIVVHSTMHLMHHNHCQINIMFVYMCTGLCVSVCMYICW